MSLPEPSITIKVDVTNPGQFFACCGLLELADRINVETEACFHQGGEGNEFHLFGCPSDLIARFRRAQHKSISLTPTELTARNGKPVKNPVTVLPFEIVLEGGQPLILDWWLRPSVHNGLKLWSGSNSLGALVEDVFDVIQNDESDFNLRHSIQLRRQPFFYAATRPLHERDFGVSLDKIDREFEHFPYIEMLAIIGLQRFRPISDDTMRFRYCSWSVRIPAALAGAVACESVPSLIQQRFAFLLLDRDSNGHKQFTQAERIINV